LKRSKKYEKSFFVPMLSFILFAFFSSNTAHAYVLYSTSVAPIPLSPTRMYYWVDPSFANYSGKTTEVVESVIKWNSTPELEFVG
jgi:hypothetical protein